MKIGPYTVSSTRGKQMCLHVVRIKRHNGTELICEVFPGVLDPDRKGHSDQFKFLKMYPQSKTRREAVRQMVENSISAADIQMLLTTPPEVSTKILKPRKLKTL